MFVLLLGGCKHSRLGTLETCLCVYFSAVVEGMLKCKTIHLSMSLCVYVSVVVEGVHKFNTWNVGNYPLYLW